jgi:hypothetical protein
MVNELKAFAKDSVRLVKRCNKPDAKGEFPFIFSSRAHDRRPLESRAPSTHMVAPCLAARACPRGGG